MTTTAAHITARITNFTTYGPTDALAFSTWTDYTHQGGVVQRCTCGLHAALSGKAVATAREYGRAHAEAHATETAGAAYFDTIGPTPDHLVAA